MNSRLLPFFFLNHKYSLERKTVYLSKRKKPECEERKFSLDKSYLRQKMKHLIFFLLHWIWLILSVFFRRKQKIAVGFHFNFTYVLMKSILQWIHNKMSVWHKSTRKVCQLVDNNKMGYINFGDKRIDSKTPVCSTGLTGTDFFQS